MTKPGKQIYVIARSFGNIDTVQIQKNEGRVGNHIKYEVKFIYLIVNNWKQMIMLQPHDGVGREVREEECIS